MVRTRPSLDVSFHVLFDVARMSQVDAGSLAALTLC